MSKRSDYAAGWEDACLIAARIFSDQANQRVGHVKERELSLAATMMRDMALRPQEWAQIADQGALSSNKALEG